MTHIANATNEPEEHEGIEITPAMIEAGVDALCGVLTDGHYESREEVVRTVYRAMANKSRHSRELSG
jgi:hypothetical protein